jgi:ATP-dependent protease Clp ATPase subunit
MHIRRLRCSFCQKTEDQVAKLVAGPRVYICNECVAVATRIMQAPSGPPVRRSRGERLRDRLHRVLQGGRRHEATLVPTP